MNCTVYMAPCVQV